MPSSRSSRVVAAASATVIAAVAGGLVAASAAPARGAERVEAGLPGGGRLEIEGLAGRLVVAPGRGPGIGLRLTGPDAAALGRVRVEAAGNRVRVDASGAGGKSGGSTTSVGSLTVIQRGGGQSSVRIGGDEAATGGSREGIVLAVDLPAGTALVVRGLVGEAEFGDAATAGLDLEAATASVRAGAVAGPARLALTGAGEIAVHEVKGPSLRVEVTGAGEVRVDGGSVDELAAELTGSGDLRFGGSTRTARLELAGSSSAKLAHVDERPEVETAGAAEVDNWP